jgi:LEA14-like dessication related protein
MTIACRALCLTLALSALAAGVAGCGMTQRPTASVIRMNMQEVGLAHATMVFDIVVDNPYSVPLPLSNLDYALSSRGQQFLAGKADMQGEIPAQSSRPYAIPVRISYTELINALEEARPGATIPYKADMGLSVDLPVLGSSRLPMVHEGQITIPTTNSLMEHFRNRLPLP